MMKHQTLSIFLFLSLFSSAQQPVGALESPELNMLYRGYPNKIIPAVTNNDGKQIDLLCNNAKIEKVENRDYFLVYPGEGRTLELNLVLTDGVTVDTIKTVSYRISNSPDPEIYWGGIKHGNLANIKAANFFVKYPPEVPLHASFEVISWETIYNGKTISGEGPRLQPAEDLFKTITEHTTLQFTIVIQSPDGIQRIRQVQWEVTPWDEAGDPNPVYIKCEGR